MRLTRTDYGYRLYPTPTTGTRAGSFSLAGAGRAPTAPAPLEPGQDARSGPQHPCTAPASDCDGLLLLCAALMVILGTLLVCWMARNDCPWIAAASAVCVLVLVCLLLMGTAIEASPNRT